MGEICFNLHELLALPGFTLFDDAVMSKYAFADDLQHKIIDHFYMREIAYDTPDYFRLKLNSKLNVLSDNYNKMLQSQLIEIDPFITEYMETTDNGHRDLHTNINTDNTGIRKTDRNTGTTSSSNGTENYKQTGSDTHQKDNTSVMVNGKLASEASNEDVDETTNRQLDRTTTTDYSETKDITENVDTTDTESNKGTDVQTGRTWTEKGSSQAHNLDVHSDTPQAMLFNEPNHYYGTGRAHDYGVVTTDADGNQSYQHYPELEPKDIDSHSYHIGGGDTPWFNYASGADNKSGHDSYDKSGTETYQKSATNDTSKSGNTSRTETDEISGDKTEKTTETEDGTLKRETGFAKNISENTKQDDKQQETFKADNTVDFDRGTTNKSYTDVRSGFTENKDAKSDTKSTEHEHTGNTQVRKGRSQKSPSELLESYRKTLQFNADMWLFTQLEPLFLGIF